MDFIHLHVHSNYSLLQGTFGVDGLVEAAAERDAPAVALTDTNALYGAMFFYEAAREAGIKPIIGAELVCGPRQCVCLAADRRGYANLCRIITERQLAIGPHTDGAGGFELPSSIAADPDGLFMLSATPSVLKRLKGDVPDDRLYAELRADEPGSFETRCPAIRGEGAGSASRRRGAPVADVADRLGIPPVATVNVNCLHPEDRPTHRVLSAIRENVTLKELNRDDPRLAGAHSRYLSADRVAERLPAALRGEAMRNTRRIAEQCNLELETEVPRFPKADLPREVSPCERLRQVAFAGARRRYGKVGRRVRERLRKELGVIEKLNFCDYFLVVRDIVEFAEREDIPHVGRGSAANSIVSYCLGISAVDPLKFNLYFERFLNEFRTDVPDIDIDFCWRRRDEVLDYVYERHGAERVAMVSTHSTLKARSAFRDVARTMGLPMDEINAHSKLLPRFSASGIEEALEMFPEMRDSPIAKEPWRTVVDAALKIDGHVRHLSVHLGGLVVGDRPLTWYTPLERSTKGVVVTQYEMDGIGMTGLVKMDLLGQRSLSIVSEAARNVEARRGTPVHLENLPDRDSATAAVLKSGRTMGCFQIESPGMRQLLQKLQAESIMELIQGLSLIRPGPSSSGMKEAFIRRCRGEEPVRYPTALLEEALSETYGVMLYQEDILRVAEAVAGFSLAEGDELRKLISKNRSRERLHQFKERFVDGAVGRGVEREVAENIWSQIESFAAYSYCKAHASTYGHISYQAAYLKAHHPAEFLAAVLANKAGFYSPRTYLADARRFNVDVLPPDVNRSDVECSPEGDAIRPGLEFVRSLSIRTIERMLGERRKRPFASLEDFHNRVRAPRQELENLILCGAFDSFSTTRPTLMMKMESLLSRDRSPPRRRPETDPGENALFAPDEAPPPPAPETVNVPEQPPYPLPERILGELRVLGFSHSGHPLDAWEGTLPKGGGRPPRALSFQLESRAGREVSFIGWLVTTRRAVTKNQEYMKFLTLEDRHGVVEVVLFPDAYRRCGAEIAETGLYRATGTVKEQHGSIGLVADTVEAVPWDLHLDGFALVLARDDRARPG